MAAVIEDAKDNIRGSRIAIDPNANRTCALDYTHLSDVGAIQCTESYR